MIKVAIKHFIYEKCINVLFNAIAINFCKKPLPQLVAGNFYKIFW